MYLRRFAEPRFGKVKKYLLTAVPAEHPDQSFTAEVGNVAVEGNFHWYTDGDGSRHHEVERLMTRIEGGATGAFASMLDGPSAFPTRWPLRPGLRKWLALWMSAQFLRTVQKRGWLADRADPPVAAVDAVADRKLADASRVNAHLDYLNTHLGSLAAFLYARPWCLGITGACLRTGDSPMVSFDVNHRDRIYEQIAVFDLALPLDSHRFLLLPCDRLRRDDPRKRMDHLTNDPGVLGPAIGGLVYDWSHRHVFHHPAHYPFAFPAGLDARMPERRDSAAGGGPQAFLGGYDVLPPGSQVDRRWLTNHAVKSLALSDGEDADHFLRRAHLANAAKAAQRLARGSNE